MEFVAGKTLHDAITAESGFPLLRCCNTARKWRMRLSTAHAAGIIHRDLKPSNVMITRSGPGQDSRFRAGQVDGPVPASWTTRSQSRLGPLTQEGAILGTVSYMSPEQAEGKPVDARSDIFSFGSVLYEMVTGGARFDWGPASPRFRRFFATT